MNKKQKEYLQSYPHTLNIFIRMCKSVNANPDYALFRGDDWYNKYQWSISEQVLFMEWMHKYVSRHLRAQIELSGRTLSPKQVDKLVKDFINNYGWKIK